MARLKINESKKKKPSLKIRKGMTKAEAKKWVASSKDRKWQDVEAYKGSDGKTYYREPLKNYVKVPYPRA